MTHVDATTEDTTKGDYQTTIVDDVTITRVTGPEPKYAQALPRVPINETKSREYSHQGSLDTMMAYLGSFDSLKGSRAPVWNPIV